MDGQEIYQANIEEPNVALAASTEAPWHKGVALPEGVELSDKTKEFSSLGDFIKGAQNDRTMISSKGIIIPAEGATDADHERFEAEASALFRDGKGGVNVVPEADKYDRPEWITENEHMTDDRRDGLYASFNEKGMSQASADNALAIYQEQVGLDMEAYKEQVAAEKASTIASFKEEFGDGFKGKMEALAKWEGDNPAIMQDSRFTGLTGTKAFADMVFSFIDATSEDSLAPSTEVTQAGAKQELTDFMADPATKSIFKHGRRGDPAYDQALDKRNRLALASAGQQ